MKTTLWPFSPGRCASDEEIHHPDAADPRPRATARKLCRHRAGAEQTGFASISQFYHHFRVAYGLPPQDLRARYTQMNLR